MKTLILNFLLLNCLFCFSQENYNSESFTVTLGDIESKTFSKDSTANAMVIYERGNSYVDNDDYDLRTHEKFKVKILNREGFNNATITIYLYNNDQKNEKVKNINATTYNTIDGKIVRTKLEEENIYEEKYNENYTLVKFTLPNIKEGSVITYSYTRISPFMFNYKGWDFQSKIPKLYSEYSASIPANWEYNIKLVGGQKLSVNETEVIKNCLTINGGGSAGCFNARYVMKNIPAFIEEDYMTSESNYLIRIDYELKTFKSFDGSITDYTKTWKTVDKELKTDPNIGKQLNKSVKAEDLLPQEIINETDTIKKAKAIYKYVQDNYTWNGDYKIFTEVSVKDLIKNKSGNVSSINILLHNLLEQTNINVKPVLLSTRNNGFPTKIHPVISDFNYLIVQTKIHNETFFLDATDNFLSFGELPFRCLNMYGRLLDFKNGSDWIDIKPRKPSNVLYSVELNFDEEENLSGIVKSKKTGYHALNAKKSYFTNQNAYINTLENNYPYLDIFDFEVINEDYMNEDFEETYNLQYNYDDTGDNIYLNPFFVKFFTENPFKLQERTYPIDFGYEDSYLYMFKLLINDNFEVLETPENVLITLPNNTGNITFSTTTYDNVINMVFRINFKESIYPAEYYTYLKMFMGKIVDIQKNSLILLKKK